MSLYKQQRALVKDKIFNNAIALFNEKGFENISVDDITKSVGVAKGTFYNYFSSKSDILALWAEQEFLRIDFIGTIKPNQSIEENLYELVRFLVKSIEKNGNLLIPFLTELFKVPSGKQAPNEKFDFIKIYSAIVRNSSDFQSIGKAYFDEKISVLNNSLFIALIDWFNKESQLIGLEQHLMKMARVCIYGVLSNLDE